MSATVPNKKRWMVAPVGAGPVTRGILLTIVAILTAVFLLAPVVLIFASALQLGVGTFFKNLAKQHQHAIWLTVLTSLVVVPINICSVLPQPGP